jgi:hypothetical protein
MSSGALRTKFFWFMLPAFLWALLILVLIGMPSYAVPVTDLRSLLSLDKMVHASVFAVLMFLLMQGMQKQQLIGYLRFNSAFYSLFFCFFYSGLTEILQDLLFVQREADIIDFIANTIGSIFGLLVFRIIFKQTEIWS